MEEVVGSIPTRSTKSLNHKIPEFAEAQNSPNPPTAKVPSRRDMPSSTRELIRDKREGKGENLAPDLSLVRGSI